MALGRKKKEESTNDKIIRLFQEGKSVEDIVGEVALRADIVTGVIQRKLGADAVPDAAIPHEKSQAASVIGAVSGAAAPAEDSKAPEDIEGMSKLEKLYLERKKKMENAPKPAAPEAPAHAGMDGISLAEAAPAEPEPEKPVALTAEPEKEPEVHRVSLVDDYKKQANIPASQSEMDGISLTAPNVPPKPAIPSYTIPSPGEEYAEMEALVPPDVESTEISDAPIASYSGEPEPAAAEETEPVAESPDAPAAPAAESTVTFDTTNKVADKMKAFALSQIEANNAKIAELETKNNAIKNEYTAKLETVNTALTLSQSTFDTIETRLNEAYAASERARDENRLAIAKAEEEYNRKMAEIDEEYRNATFEANNKFQEFDDQNRLEIAKLDEQKSTAQADLVLKRKAVAEVHQMIDGESEKLVAQINALKEENAGYQSFLK